MGEQDVAAMLRESMVLTVKLGGPVLMAALAVGLLMSILQAATQINEQTLAFVPKIAAMAGAVLITGSFMLGALTDFTIMIFDRIVQVGGQ
jgi:flagellar biosynthesis protein FliQ